jgi:hypothetical protein
MQRVKLNNERLTERRRKAEEDENKYQAQEEARKQADATKRLADRRKKVEQEKLRRELECVAPLKKSFESWPVPLPSRQRKNYLM